jgi:uncharacterized membrane protein
MLRRDTNNAPNSEFDLRLIYEERIGDILFFVGTILAINSTFQAERSIITKIFRIRPIQDNSVYTIATSSWLFLIASLIFAHAAILRLAELSKNASTPPAYLKASQILVTGNIIKVFGFALAAIGNQMKVNSLSQTTAISQ